MIRYRDLISMTVAVLLAGCNWSPSSDVRGRPSSTEPVPATFASPSTFVGDRISRCVMEASTERLTLRAMGDSSIYSKTGDFDGDGEEDIAVLVSSENRPGRNGLIVCRNTEQQRISRFGALFHGARRMTSFDEDNFITVEWEVIPKKESAETALGPDGKSRIASRNKGDVISFFHEGGSVFIFWDGESFMLVEGG